MNATGLWQSYKLMVIFGGTNDYISLQFTCPNQSNLNQWSRAIINQGTKTTPNDTWKILMVCSQDREVLSTFNLSIPKNFNACRAFMELEDISANI